jgi:hypothetical protein
MILANFHRKPPPMNVHERFMKRQARSVFPAPYVRQQLVRQTNGQTGAMFGVDI